MVLPVLLLGHPKLKDISKEVDDKNLNLRDKLISEMFETLHKANGVSLSAVQVGYPFRIFVIELNLKKEKFHFKETFINPEIIDYSKRTVKKYEGCLSAPGVIPLIERPESIKLTYYDVNNIKHTKNFSGEVSRLIQHEMEHLDGDIYINKINQLWYDTLKPTIDKIKNRDIENLGYLYK
ncbi:MAG: peptide deformylase [bacterium]